MKVLRIDNAPDAAAAEIHLFGSHGLHRVTIRITPPGWRQGQGGSRNLELSPADARILAYAILTAAERATDPTSN